MIWGLIRLNPCKLPTISKGLYQASLFDIFGTYSFIYPAKRSNHKHFQIFSNTTSCVQFIFVHSLRKIYFTTERDYQDEADSKLAVRLICLWICLKNCIGLTFVYCQAQPKPKLEAGMDMFSIVTTTQLPTKPPTHPDKSKFGIIQHNSQKQSSLTIWVEPINAFGSILSPLLANLDQHQA